jgi:predicted permease
MFSDLYFRLRSLFRTKAVEQELDDELRFHYEREVEKYVDRGMSREEAGRRARLALGGIGQVKDECREARGVSFFQALSQDVRYTARSFLKSPGFSTVAIVMLALGIGATTAMFSVLDGVLLKPLPYPRPEQLVSVNLSPTGVDANRRVMSPEPYFVFREDGRTFQNIGIFAETDTDRDVNVTGFAEPERVHAVYVTDSVLNVLGIPPLAGRLFSPSDDLPAAAPAVMLTYGYWERKFGLDPSAVGKTLIVDGVAREIIGVMPREFRFLDSQRLSLILPLQLQRNTTFQGNLSYSGIARLNEGATLDQATADVDRMLPIMYRKFPPAAGLSAGTFQKLRLKAVLRPLKEEVTGDVGTLLWVLMAGVAIVLLIACANVANLLLVRTAGREQELRVRAALGASRRRIAVQLLRESAVLGLLGGVCGVGLSWITLRILVREAPSGLPRVSDVAIDIPTLLFAIAIVPLVSLLLGLIPVFKYAGVPAGVPSGGRGMTASREHHRTQMTLVMAQVALALVLLIGSGLMLRSFTMLSRVKPGYQPAEVQTFAVSISSAAVAENEAVLRLEQKIQDKLAAIPGVSSVAFGSAVPMDGNRAPQDNVRVDGREAEQQPVPPSRRDMFVSPGYLHTLRISLLAGRDFTWTEMYNKAPVAMISDGFAREYWHTPDAALGKRIRPAWGAEWREIIGVVADVKTEALEKPARSTVYWPILVTNARGGTRVIRFVTFVVRSPLAGSNDFGTQIRQAAWSVDSNMPLANLQTLGYFYARSTARTSFTLVILILAGGVALLLGTVGLYGVISYSVSRRTREIGVRIALGARPETVLKLIMARVMTTIATGLMLGIASAFVLTRLLASMLFGVSPADPLTYMVVVLLLGVVMAAASFAPAARAARLDPVVALRQD